MPVGVRGRFRVRPAAEAYAIGRRSHASRILGITEGSAVQAVRAFRVPFQVSLGARRNGTRNDHAGRLLCQSACNESWLGRCNATPGLIHHSDRGCQYASCAFRAELAQHGIRASMSRKANCYDNAVAESFFHSLKVELVHGIRFATRAEARAAVFDYIEVFYNRTRVHSTLDYKSPVEFEAA